VLLDLDLDQEERPAAAPPRVTLAVHASNGGEEGARGAAALAASVVAAVAAAVAPFASSEGVGGGGE
jgi:putative aminopeptidase FrvX